MAIYKDGENWRAVYRYTDWTGENEVLKPNVKLRLGSENSLSKRRRILI